MQWFEKTFYTTLAIGFGMLGVFAAAFVLRVAIGVVGIMLGSSLGTIALAFLLWKGCDYWRKSRE